jgi:hypothetical protein
VQSCHEPAYFLACPPVQPYDFFFIHLIHRDLLSGPI